MPLSTAVGALDSRNERYASSGMQLTQLRLAEEALDVVPVDAGPVAAVLRPVEIGAILDEEPLRPAARVHMADHAVIGRQGHEILARHGFNHRAAQLLQRLAVVDRKSTRLNSSH